jgi:hypothetical protein
MKTGYRKKTREQASSSECSVASRMIFRGAGFARNQNVGRIVNPAYKILSPCKDFQRLRSRVRTEILIT